MVLKNKIFLAIACACLLGVFVYGNVTSAPKASRDTIAVKLAVDALKVNLKNPVEGIDTNILSMAEKIVDNATSGVTVKLIAVKNPQISSNGDITYGENDVTGRVTFQLNKNRSKLKQVFTITVPKKIEAVDPNIADVQAGKDALTNLVLEVGEEDNVINIVQQKVDEVVSGVEVSILQSENSQVALDGEVTSLVNQEVIGNVTFKLAKGNIIDFVTGGVTVKPGLELGFDPVVGGYNVKSYGAVGNGVIDDTIAINNTISYVNSIGGGVVYLPPGIYKVSCDGSYIAINMKSDVTLLSSPETEVVLTENNYTSYSLIRMIGINNAKVIGGTFIGDKDIHTGTTGEWGHIVSVQGSNNIEIKDATLSKGWGDGIYIGSTASQNYCDQVILEKVVCDSNRRNGLSIVSGKNITLVDSVFSNNNGTLPKAGICVEPNTDAEFAQNIQMKNCQAYGNGTWGIHLALSNIEAQTVNNHSIKVINCKMYNNGLTGEYGSSQANGAVKPYEYYNDTHINVSVIDDDVPLVTNPVNMVTNSKPNSTTGYTVSQGCTGSVANGEYSMTLTGADARVIYDTGQSVTAGDKLLVRAKFKDPSGGCQFFQWWPGINNSSFSQYNVSYYPEQNYWYTQMAIITAPSTGTFSLSMRFYYPSYSGKIAKFKDLEVINLTSHYGAGNEIHNGQIENAFPTPITPDYIEGYNVLNYGAKGDGVNDDTVAINNLITTVSNAGGGIIYVPSGNYLIDTSGYSGILMKSNVDLILHDNATLVEKDSSQYNTAVVRFRGIENASITGGKIYGKRRFHVGDSNEWAHGIAIQGSNLIDVKGVYIYDCWGDGICLADNPSGLSYSSNVTIDGVTCDNNCRQGLSVTSGLRSTIIKNSIFSNSHHDTSLSGPNDGIDIEPNDPLKAPYLELTIDNCQFINNGMVGLPATLGGYGISCAFGRSYWHSDAWNIVVRNCTGYGNTNGLTSAWCGYRNNVTIIDSNFNKTPLTSYTNMFSNPTFSPDITGWTLSGATFNSSASGVATVTPTGNTVYLRQTVANSITGHKYYYSMDVKATASTLATIKPSVSTGTIFPGGHADGAAGALAGRGTNYWFKVGGITKCTAGGTNTCTTTVTYSAFSGTLQFRNPRCIDLTALFGSGNEPSDAECYELFF